MLFIRSKSLPAFSENYQLSIQISIYKIRKFITIKSNKMKKDDQEISYATNKKNIQKSKIVFVGDQYVGKTSVITRFIKNSFDNQSNPTIGIDFVSKNISLGAKMMRLQLWDTAGQERFRSLIPNYIRDCQVAMIIFDLTNQESYENIQKWIDFVKENRGQDAMVVIVGNKVDLTSQRKIDKETASKKFKSMGNKYFQLSAKTGQNVQTMFKQICAELLNISSDGQIPPLQIQQSKVVSNVNIQRQQPKSKQTPKKQVQAPKPQPGKKLTKQSLQSQRRIKEKGCC